MTPTIIQEIERAQIRAVTAQRMVPEFSPGDTVRVMVKVVGDGRSRPQGQEEGQDGRAQDDRPPPGLRGRGDGPLRQRPQRELHGPQDLLRRGRGARVPDLFALHRRHRGAPPRQGAPGQALLPARPPRQVGAHLRAHGRARQAAQRRLQGLQEAQGRARRSHPDQDHRRRSWPSGCAASASSSSSRSPTSPTTTSPTSTRRWRWRAASRRTTGWARPSASSPRPPPPRCPPRPRRRRRSRRAQCGVSTVLRRSAGRFGAIRLRLIAPYGASRRPHHPAPAGPGPR